MKILEKSPGAEPSFSHVEVGNPFCANKGFTKIARKNKDKEKASSGCELDLIVERLFQYCENNVFCNFKHISKNRCKVLQV